jgi:hypothetical protein
MKSGLNENSIAIYTCITGGYDIPTDNFEHKDGYNYFLFSDFPIKTNSWRNMLVTFNNASNLSNVKKQRFIKTHPFNVLKDYDIVVWVDANTDFNQKLYDYIENNKNSIITFKQHPNRDCIYDEIKECVLRGKEERKVGDNIRNKLISENYPKHNGLYETNIIISHVKDINVRRLFESWWHEIYHFSHRDQLSLNYIIWKYGFSDIITVSCSNDFKPKPHKKYKKLL